MSEISINRQTIISIYNDAGNTGLLPNNALYPNDTLYPSGGSAYIDGDQFGIISGSLHLQEILCTEELKFGEYCSNKFECQVYGDGLFDMTGYSIDVFQVENDVTIIPVFSGIIDSAKKDVSNFSRTIVAYDCMYKHRDMNVADWWTAFWNDDPSKSVPLKTLRNSLLDYVGVTYESATLPFDNLQITKYSDFTQIKFSDMLRMICELQLCFPNVNRSGQLEFVRLSSAIKDCSGNIDTSSTTIEDYTTNPISGVGIYSSASELMLTYGDVQNMYKFCGNIFINDLLAETMDSVCNTILNELQGLSYTPGTMALIISDYDYKLGDSVTGFLDVERFIIMSNTFSGSILIDQAVSCKAAGENMSSTLSTDTEKYTLDKKLNIFERDLDHTVSLIQGEDGLQSKVEQLAGSITSTVKNALDNIQIGGRNLFKWANTLSTVESVWVIQNGSVNAGVATLSRVTGETRMYQLPSSGYWEWKPETTYTVAIDARATKGSPILQILPVGATGVDSKEFTLGSTYQRCVYTFTTGDNVSTGSMSFHITTNNTSAALTRPKLEIGDVATDFTIATEDIQQQVATMETKIEQTVDKIDMIVESPEGTSELRLTDQAIEAIAQQVKISGDLTIQGYVDQSVQTVKDSADSKVTTVDVEYYLSTSSSTLSGGSWVTVAPNWVNGLYMWSRTKITDGTGKVTYSPSENGTCIAGAAGKDGKDGEDGSNVYVHFAYSTSENGVENFSVNPFVGATYIGTRSDNTSKDSLVPSDYDWALFKGKDGIDGKDGEDGKSVSIKGSVPNSSQLPTTANDGDGWLTTDNGHLWVYADGKWTDVGQIKGDTGATGTGIASIVEEYYVSDSNEKLEGGSWSTTPPNGEWQRGKYIWTRSKITYKDPTSVEYTTPVCDSSWEAVNDIQVGGRNYLFSTGDLTGWYHNTSYIPDENFDGDVVMIPHGTTQSWNYVICSPKILYETVKDRVVTFSCYIKTDGASTTGYPWIGFARSTSETTDNSRSVYNSIFYNTTDNAISTYPTDSWKRISKTFVINDAFFSSGTRADNDIYLFAQIYNYSLCNLYVKDIMLEFGNTLSDWQEAPEDAIARLSDSIDGVSQFVKDTQEQVKTAEGEIRNTANNLAQLQSGFDELNGYVYISNGNIILGINNSPYKCRITSTAMEFIQDNDVIAYFTPNALRIQQNLDFGSNWTWERDDANDTLTLRGGGEVT